MSKNLKLRTAPVFLLYTSMLMPSTDLLPSTQKTGWPWQKEAVVPFDPSLSWPKISIIVPSYQQGHFIEETLRSILLQQYPHLELIVVDGGSTDQTKEILEQYNPWISRWVSEKDRGQSHALNKGIAWATGDFIGWQNSDDIYYPGALRALALKAMQGYDVVYSHIKGIDTASQEMVRLYFVPFRHWILQYHGIVFSNQAALYRRSIMQKLGIDEQLHYAMDFDLEFRLWQAGARFALLNSFLGAIRFHADAKTVKEFHQRVKQEEMQVRQKHGLPIKQGLSIGRQYPWQHARCLGHILWHKTWNGGLKYWIVKKLGFRPDPFRQSAQ